jgi:hypothetical protein
MAFFELRTPRDIFEKAKREYARLEKEYSIDHVFNFFVTAYHIQDYVRKSGLVPQHVLDAFLSDVDLKDCRDLCDKGKHMRLTHRADPTTDIWSSTIGGAPIGALSLCGDDEWILLTGNRRVNIKWLAKSLLSKWESFLADNKL